MASLTETLGANNAPPTQGLNVSNDVISGVKAGVDLATASEQVEGQKTQLAQQKLQLDQAKFTSFNGMMQTLNRASPSVAKAMAPQIKQKFQAMGFDPAIVDATMSDPEFGRGYVNMANALSGKVQANPEALSNALRSTQSIGELDSVVQGYNAHVAQQANMNVEQVKSSTELQKAQIMADAAMGRQSTREEGLAQREFKRITNDPNVSSLVSAHQQGTKDLALLRQTMSTGEGIPLNVIQELGQGVGTMVTNLKNSTGGEREAQTLNNLLTKAASLENKVSVNGVATVNDPKLFKQIDDQFTRLMDSTESNLDAQANKLKRVAKDKYINEQQDQAIQNIKNQIQANNVRSGRAKAPTPATPPSNPNQAKIDQAKAAGYSDAEISAFLNQQAGK